MTLPAGEHLPSDEQMQRLVAQLRQMPGLAEQLPPQQAAVVTAALNRQSVHVIASDQGLPEAAVWEILSNAARLATGNEPGQRVETGGMGSDTDPGVTGGYGETGFGSLGIDQPPPTPEEPPFPDEG